LSSLLWADVNEVFHVLITDGLTSVSYLQENPEDVEIVHVVMG
jgi:hypothetical protein